MEIFWTTNLSNGDTVPLVDDGHNKKVLHEEVEDYIQEVIKMRSKEADTQIDSMKSGFMQVCPLHVLRIYTWDGFEERVRGPNEISLEVFQSITEYSGCEIGDRITKNFWNIFKSFTNEERSSFLKFVWGRDRLPIKSKLGGVNFKLNRNNGGDGSLPTAGTCYFQLNLPDYSSEEVMRKQLVTAIETCGEIDND